MSRILICVVLAVHSTVAIAEEPDVPSKPTAQTARFATTLTSLPRRVPDSPLTLEFDKLVAPARQLATELGPDSIDFLEERLRKGKGNDGVLAAFTLAAMPGENAAIKALCHAATHSQPGWNVAITAIGFMPREELRGVAERMVVEAETGEQRAQFIELLGIVGNAESLESLKQPQRDDANTYVQKAAKDAVTLLEHKLALANDAQRAECENQALRLWRVKRDVCINIVTSACDRAAAEKFAASGEKASLALLLLRFQAGDRVATELIGIQQETSAIPELAPYVAEDTHLGAYARRALGALGTPEARQVLMSGFTAGKSNMNWHLARTLARCGDEDSSKFLRRLGEDPSYDEKSRRAFGRAADAIEERRSEE